MNVPVKKGMLLRHQGHFFFVEDLVEHHSGKQRPTVRVTLRHALDGRHIERTVDELLPIDEVPCTYRTMQYLYAKGPARVFMDSQTFEEVELNPAASYPPSPTPIDSCGLSAMIPNIPGVCTYNGAVFLADTQ